MEVRFTDDNSVRNVDGDDPVVRAYLASGKCIEIEPGGLHDRVVEAPVEVQETPEKPKRGRSKAAEKETR